MVQIGFVRSTIREGLPHERQGCPLSIRYALDPPGGYNFAHPALERHGQSVLFCAIPNRSVRRAHLPVQITTQREVIYTLGRWYWVRLMT